MKERSLHGMCFLSWFRWWLIILNFLLVYIWVKAFKNGPSKVYGRQPLKKFEVIWSTKADHFKLFKGCLPQILLGSIFQ